MVRIAVGSQPQMYVKLVGIPRPVPDKNVRVQDGVTANF